MPSLSPTFVSLFCGCGGLDSGFLTSGYKPLLSVDNDETALSVHEENLNSPTQFLDLSKNDPVIEPFEPIDVLLAGSPCQGFSTLGKRQITDPRNELLFVAARFAAKQKPKVVVAENVLGAVSGEHRNYWDTLHHKLRGVGYRTFDLRVDSSHYGVAQKRLRIFLIAWRTDVIKDVVLGKRSPLVLADVLGGLDGLPNHCPHLLPPSSNDYKIASRINMGQKLTNARGGETAVHTWDIPEVFGTTSKREREVLCFVLRARRQNRRRSFGDADPVLTRTLNSEFGSDVIQKLVAKNYLRKIGHYHDLTNTFNGKYRRLQLDAPSHTVDTRFGDFRLFLHPTENRGFTIREAARIQGFPDNFTFSGTTAQQYRLIGNAVPPPVAEKIASLVRGLIKE